MVISIDHQDFSEDFINAFGSEYSYVVKAIENNNHKKLSFLKYLSSQGFIPIGTEESLYEMTKIFKDKFQENQDLAFEVVEENSREVFYLMPYFKVLYPEITITNSEKEKHTIKNLVVLFSLKWNEIYNKWTLDEMSGLRLTLSYLESYYSYSHSHLSCANFKEFFKNMKSNKFCLGSSTLGTTIAEYNTEEDKEKSKLLLEGILYTLDTYVTWESLEGIPHNYMRNLIPLGGHLVRPDFISSDSRVILNYFKNNRVPLPLDYGIKDTTIFIKNTPKNALFFKELLEYSTLTDRSTINQKYLCFSNENNLSTSFLKVSSDFTPLRTIVQDAKYYKAHNLYGIGEKFTFFNGRKHFLVFSNYMEKTIDTNKQNIIIYPKFLEDVYRKLESEIQKNRLRSQTIKYLNTLRSTKGSPRQNQITL